MKTIIDGTAILAGDILAAIEAGDPVSLIDEVGPLLISTQRSFAGIIPHVVLEEAGDDELRITDHPVEIGAAITDHAFKMPVVLHLARARIDINGNGIALAEGNGRGQNNLRLAEQGNP